MKAREGGRFQSSTRKKARKAFQRVFGHNLLVNRRYYRGTSLRKIGEEIEEWWQNIRNMDQQDWKKEAKIMEKKWYKNNDPLYYEYFRVRRPKWRKQQDRKTMKRALSWIEKNRSKFHKASSYVLSRMLKDVKAIQEKYGFETKFDIKSISFRNVPSYEAQNGISDINISLFYQKGERIYMPIDSRKDPITVLLDETSKTSAQEGIMTLTASSYEPRTGVKLQMLLAAKKVKDDDVNAMQDLDYRYDRSRITAKTISLDSLNVDVLEKDTSIYGYKVSLKKALSNYDKPFVFCLAYPYRRNGEWYVDLASPDGTYELQIGNETVHKKFQWPPDENYTEEIKDRSKKQSRVLKKLERTVNGE